LAIELSAIIHTAASEEEQVDQVVAGERAGDAGGSGDAGGRIGDHAPGLAGAGAGDGVRAERVTERPSRLHSEVALQVDAGVIEQFSRDLDQRAVLERAQRHLTERRIRGADRAALSHDRRSGMRGRLRDLDRLTRVGVEDRRTGLQDCAGLDQVLDQTVIEAGRHSVAACGRGALSERTEVDRALRPDLEEPGALAAHPVPQL
jgi:hypothetical protein